MVTWFGKCSFLFGVFEDGDLEKGKFSRWLGWTLSPLPISRSMDACPSLKPKRKDFHIFQSLTSIFLKQDGCPGPGLKTEGGNCFSWWVLSGCVGCMSISNGPDLCRESKGERGWWEGVLSSYRRKMLSPTEQSEMGSWVGW